MRIINFFLSTLLATSYATKAEYLEAGEQAFKINCLACHQVDKFTVGPSLIEISKKYPKNNLDKFLAWANEPGKVNPKAIQMPSMAHVGNETLGNIHLYILDAAKGKKEKKKVKNPFNKGFKRKITYPYVRRAYMPETSPASIGIIFNKEFGIAWDTTIANIRYGFEATRPYMNAHKLQKQLDLSGIIYQKKNEQLFSFASTKNKNYEFIGYKLKNNLPELLYQFGDIKIRERILPGSTAKSYIRQFNISGVNETSTLDLSDSGNSKITATKGTLNNKKLTLTADEVKDFAIEVTIK